MNKKIINGGIAIIFIAMLLSCENDIKVINSISDSKKTPVLRGLNVEMNYSDSAILKAKLIAKEVLVFSNDENPYKEFPQGILVINYDKNKKEESSIRANYAIYWEKEERWEARKDVEAKNVKGEILNTEYLVWDMVKKKFFSDQKVKITQETGITYGEGFESDDRLVNWNIYKVTGTQNLDE